MSACGETGAPWPWWAGGWDSHLGQQFAGLMPQQPSYVCPRDIEAGPGKDPSAGIHSSPAHRHREEKRPVSSSERVTKVWPVWTRPACGAGGRELLTQQP